jgi:hypothetical protein
VEKGSRQNSPLIEPVLNGAKGKEINLRFLAPKIQKFK